MTTKLKISVRTTRWRGLAVRVRTVGLLMLLISATACIAIPHPYEAQEITFIKDEEIKFITAGTTKREEIQARFGEPMESYGDDEQWAYLLKSRLPGGVQWCGEISCTDKKSKRINTYLEITFGENGIVESRRTVSSKQE